MPSHIRVRRAALVFLAFPVARAFAQTSPTRRDSTRADSARTLATVEIRGSVSGLGKVRGANSVNRAELQSTIAGTSPLKAVERLPGVNFQAADPFGAYEWSTRVTIRGFQTGQIGQTFDASRSATWRTGTSTASASVARWIPRTWRM
jgi:iron complex outermembrane receptor protein